MKILFFCSTRNGGTEKAASQLLKELVLQKHSITFASFDNRDHSYVSGLTGIDFFQMTNDNVTRFLCDYDSCIKDGILKYILKIIRKILNSTGSLGKRILRYYVKLHSTIPDENFDVVFDFLGYGYPQIIYSSESFAPIRVIWVHDEDMKWVKSDRDILSKYSYICCVSKAVLRAVNNFAPELKEKTVLMYNLHDFSEIKLLSRKNDDLIPLKSPSIVTVGRLDKQKGIDIAVKAASILKKKGIDFYWYILGEGNHRSKIQRMIIKYHLDSNFILLGQVDNPYPYMLAADIYVQPSRSEGFGLAVQEAKLLNRPIIVSDSPSLMEQVENGINGLVVRLSPKTLAAACENLLEDQAARVVFSKYLSEETVSNDYSLAVLKQILSYQQSVDAEKE